MNEHADKLNALRNQTISRLIELIKKYGKFYENTGNYILSAFLPDFNISVLMRNEEGVYEKDHILRVVYESWKDLLGVETNNSDLTHCSRLTTDDIVALCEYMEVFDEELAGKMAEYDHKQFLP
jgi:hypothetical protein